MSNQHKDRGEQAKDLGRGIKEDAKGKKNELKDKAGQKLEHAGHEVRDDQPFSEKAKNKAHELKHNAGEKLQNVGDRLKNDKDDTHHQQQQQHFGGGDKTHEIRVEHIGDHHMKDDKSQWSSHDKSHWEQDKLDGLKDRHDQRIGQTDDLMHGGLGNHDTFEHKVNETQNFAGNKLEQAGNAVKGGGKPLAGKDHQHDVDRKCCEHNEGDNKDKSLWEKTKDKAADLKHAVGNKIENVKNMVEDAPGMTKKEAGETVKGTVGLDKNKRHQTAGRN